jgi:hypothetical protein
LQRLGEAMTVSLSNSSLLSAGHQTKGSAVRAVHF